MKRLWLLLLPACLMTGVVFLLNGQNRSLVTAETQKLARDILNSPAAQYLSESGRTALAYTAGELPYVSTGSGRSIAIDSASVDPFTRPFATTNGEVMVNNPDQDFRAAEDISTQSETAVAGFNQIVVVAFNDMGQLGNPFSPTAVTGYSRSVDGGATFTDIGNLPAPQFGANLGDPGLAVDRSGNFYASSLISGQVGQAVGIYRSTDGGLTWPLMAVPPAGTAGSAADKPFITVDTSSSAYQGNVYVSWTSFEAPTPFEAPGIRIAFSRSTNKGLNFTPRILLSAPNTINQGSEPAAGPGGEVYVSWAQFSPGPPLVMVARSLNGGRTFSPPVAAAPFTPIGFGVSGIGGNLNGNFRVSVWPRIDVNPVNGNVYVVYASNPPGADGSDIFLVTSTDRGQTWSAPVRVNDDTTQNDQFFPDVAVHGQGVVQVTWYDRRNDRENRLIDVYRARVTVNGQTVSANERLTTVSFPPAVGYDPTANRTYMGDYLDVKAFITPAGRSTFFGAAWGDNRREIITAGGRRHDQDVFFRRF